MKSGRKNDTHTAEMFDASQFRPRVRFEPTVIPQGNGEFLIKPGKPIVEQATDEIALPKAARELGLSIRYMEQLCELGHIQHRRKSAKKRSHIMIPRTEIIRYQQKQKEER